MFTPRFLAQHRQWMPGAAVAICEAAAILLLSANYTDKVTPLSPTLLVCYVCLLFAADGNPLCVLAKCEE
jgi:hypothetical protein